MSEIVEDVANIEFLLADQNIDPVVVEARDEIEFAGHSYEGIVVELKNGFETDSITTVHNLFRLGGYEPVLDSRNDSTGNLLVKGLKMDTEKKPIDEFPVAN